MRSPIILVLLAIAIPSHAAGRGKWSVVGGSKEKTVCEKIERRFQPYRQASKGACGPTLIAWFTVRPGWTPICNVFTRVQGGSCCDYLKNTDWYYGDDRYPEDSSAGHCCTWGPYLKP